MFPIKYIENNMILNQQGEWWAYYELIPYNYAFLSPDEKMAVHERFRQIMTVNREGKMHALCIASETSVRDRQERCLSGCICCTTAILPGRCCGSW